ncbi:hypothetical protein AgCh_034226 [Apium graveolens]
MKVVSGRFVNAYSTNDWMLGVVFRARRKHCSVHEATMFPLVIGRTEAVTIQVAGVLKDWILIALSTVIFPESIITGLNITGYAIGIKEPVGKEDPQSSARARGSG